MKTAMYYSRVLVEETSNVDYYPSVFSTQVPAVCALCKDEIVFVPEGNGLHGRWVHDNDNTDICDF